MRLYNLDIGGNNISEPISIFPLKEIPELIILELFGNKICSIENSRSFTIFHLSNLKILNGNEISSSEKDLCRGTNVPNS